MVSLLWLEGDIGVRCILVVAEGGGGADEDAGLLLIMAFLEGGVVPQEEVVAKVGVLYAFQDGLYLPNIVELHPALSLTHVDGQLFLQELLIYLFGFTTAAQRLVLVTHEFESNPDQYTCLQESFFIVFHLLQAGKVEDRDCVHCKVKHFLCEQFQQWLVVGKLRADGHCTVSQFLAYEFCGLEGKLQQELVGCRQLQSGGDGLVLVFLAFEGQPCLLLFSPALFFLQPTGLLFLLLLALGRHQYLQLTIKSLGREGWQCIRVSDGLGVAYTYHSA